MTTQAIIFDLDGLLIASEPVWQRVEVEVFAKFGLNIALQDTLRTTGLRVDEVVAFWKRERPGELQGESIQVQTAILDGMEAQIRTNIEPMPGAIEAIKLASSTGLPLAIASSSSMRLISAALDGLDVANAFGLLMSAEHLEAGKPDPAIYTATAARLDVDASKCVALEDSLNGIRAARAAQMHCIAVPAPHDRETAEQLASTSIDSLTALTQSMLLDWFA